MRPATPTTEPRRTFLPQSRRLLARALAASGCTQGLEPERLNLFERLLASHLHYRHHDRIEALKALYAPFDPEFDAAFDIPTGGDEAAREALVEAFASAAIQGNYFELSQAELEYALNHRSLFRINLHVDLGRYEVVRVFARGETTTTERIRRGFSLRKKDVEVPCYRRIALLLVRRPQPADTMDGEAYPPVVMKLFSMVPKADLEMLFPDIDISMTLTDRLVIAAGFLGGLAGVIIKAGAGLVAMAAVLWFLLRRSLAHGAFPPLSPGEITAMVGGISALVAIGAFIYKQWSNYRNRRLRFMHKLFNSLYFRNLDNHGGVLTRLVDEAEEEDFKEAWLAFVFLHASGPLSEAELDGRIEAWFEREFDTRVDFDCEDALEKLTAFGLVERHKDGADGRRIEVPDLATACRILDARWDDYYRA